MPARKCLVTGAAGFIGANLVRELLRQGVSEIVALDDLSGGFRENLPSGVQFTAGSVLDNELLARVFAENHFDYVYHLAAYAAEGLSHFIRRFNYNNNLIGSVNLINQSILHGVKCFIFTSSIAVYGPGQLPMTEQMIPEPEDPYGIAKLAVELDLKAAQLMFGLPYVIFRPHNVYGEFQNIGDKYRNVVGIFMNQILRGEPLSVFGDGEQQRAFTYVGDIVGPIARSAWTSEAYGQVFNVGADTPCTVNQLAREVSKAMDSLKHPVRYLPSRKEVKLAYSDHAALNRVFGQQQSTSLQTGLERMAAWVRQVGGRSSPRFKDIEVAKNLPPSWLD